MTIRKLLKELKKHDANKIVLFFGPEGKFENLGELHYSEYLDILFLIPRKIIL